ncbi:hypothetical protein M2140_000075 [Clostridiales Family XIII bacterium PM5-7]
MERGRAVKVGGRGGMMDAKKFLETCERMCIAADHDCERCYMIDYCLKNPQDRDDTYYLEAVESWLKDHPPKTRQDVFLEQFPNVELDNGIILLEPCDLDTTLRVMDCDLVCIRNKKYGSCRDCTVVYWNEEVE